MAVLTYKCPNCDGPLTWNGKKEKFVCEYCLSAFTESELKALAPTEAQSETVDAATAAAVEESAGENGESAQAFNTGADTAESKASAAGNDTKKPKKMKLYSCPTCGAQIVTDQTTAATTCYYCHNPIVLMDKFSDDLIPGFIIPFAIDKKQAVQIFTDWVKKQKYVPKDFYNAQQIEHLSGVYFPYWIYSCTVKSAFQGTARSERTWTSGGMKNTETSIYDISNSSSMNVSSLSRIALNKASKVLCESVLPFELDNTKIKSFQVGYLQGYISENRDIEKEQISEAVRQEVRQFAASEIRKKAGEGVGAVSIQSENHSISDEVFSYALMPVWTMTYKGNDGKIYYFSINGQTGKTCGELPTDAGRLRMLFIKVFAAVFILAMLIMLIFIR